MSDQKLKCFIRQRVSSYSSDPCMLPVASLITYRALFCLISFAIKTVAVSPKKNFAAYFDAQDGSPKTWDLESGNGVTERNTESNINDRKILYKNTLTLKCTKQG